MDKRTFPRIPQKISVKVRTISSTHDETGEEGVTRDISGRGICLALSTPYKPKTLLSLKFRVSKREDCKTPFSLILDKTSDVILTTCGKVAWCRKSTDESGYDLGIEFSPRNFAEAKRLYSMLPYFLCKD